jgi:hypothetical protein
MTSSLFDEKNDKLSTEIPEMLLGDDLIINIAADGNCLFNAASRWLKDQRDTVRTPDTIRALSADYMKRRLKDSDVADVVLESLDEHNDAIRTQQTALTETIDYLSTIGEDTSYVRGILDKLTELETPGDYIRHVQKDKVFGGKAELFSISRMYSVCVQIYCQADKGVFITGGQPPIGDPDKCNGIMCLLLNRGHYSLLGNPLHPQ